MDIKSLECEIMYNKSNESSFKFSVIINVSDNTKFLEQSIDSIISQSLNFKDNIQIILINDTYNAQLSDIINYYHEKYSENIMLISKEYLNESFASNSLFKLPSAEYVTFLDANDYFSSNTFMKVKQFIDKFDVDVISIGLSNVDEYNPEHELNYKYSEDKIIDLKKNPNNPQVNLRSCFVKKVILEKYEYDKTLFFSNEMLLINQLLFEKQKMGVVSGARYNIKKSYSYKLENDSTQEYKQSIGKINNVYKKLIRMDRVIPQYILYAIAYDLQNIIRIPELNFLDKNEKSLLNKDLNEIISYLDDDILYDNQNIDSRLKSFFIYLKKGTYTLQIEDDNLIMKTENYLIDSLNVHRIWLDIVDIKENKLNISGILLTNFYLESLQINLIIEKNNKKEVIPCKYLSYPQDERRDLKFLSIPWRFNYNFDVSINLTEDSNYKCSFEVIFEEKDITFYYHPKIEFNLASGFSSLSIYTAIDNYIIFRDSSSISVIPYSFKKLFNFEIKSIMKILSSSENGKFTASLYHLLYLMFYPFLHKRELWLFNDRLDSADDNAKYLFKYALKQDDGIKKYFVIDKKSKDYNLLKKSNKNILAYASFKHKILYLFCNKRISSFLSERFYNPFYNEKKDHRKFFNNMVTAPRYFIQHGVIYRDLTSQIKRFNHNLTLILTSSDLERQSFFDLNYNYPKQVVQTLGLPRYDTLTKNDTQKKILFIPSWRSYLDKNETLLIHSDYYKMIQGFLNNEDLKKLLEKSGYELIFKPHPELVKHIEKFNINNNIKISINDSFQDLFNSSALLITDFSSVIFDFSYLKKPVMYYQPNNDFHYEQEYIDYENMGFGDVIKNEDELINKISSYIKNNCIMEDKYQKRVDLFFKYNDTDNSKRVYNWIKSN